MTFSDRIEEICREFNHVRVAVSAKGLTREQSAYYQAEIATINYCLGTLGIPCVRDTSGYITGFEIMGAIHEVRS